MTRELASDGASGNPKNPDWIIEARDLSVRFGGIVALTELSLGFVLGERSGILGPNGAGKTTLLDVLSGMRAPSSGQVLFKDADIARQGPTRISRLGLRRTFQRQQPFGWLSVADNVLVALEWRHRGRRIVADLLALPSKGHRREELMIRVDEVLESCGLGDIRDEPAASLPIGQVRLLEFARAIADWPTLLLLDEPTSGLAQSDADRLARVMIEVNRTSGCGYVLVEHDVAFVTRVCERLVVLDQGRMLADGTPDLVLRDPLVVNAYLGQRPSEDGG